MKKDFLEEEIKSKNKIDFSFQDIEKRIQIKEKHSSINLKLVLPALACAFVCVFAIVGVMPNTNSSEPNENISSENRQPPGGTTEPIVGGDGNLVTIIPQTIYWNSIQYDIVLSDGEEQYELDRLITHLINEDDLVNYNNDFPLNSPIVAPDIYDQYLNNRIEVYSIKKYDADQIIAVKSSDNTYYFINNNYQK